MAIRHVAHTTSQPAASRFCRLAGSLRVRWRRERFDFRSRRRQHLIPLALIHRDPAGAQNRSLNRQIVAVGKIRVLFPANDLRHVRHIVDITSKPAE